MTDDELSKAYDEYAEKYLSSRTQSEGLEGFHNREVERPMMFSAIPADLDGKNLLDIGCGPGIHAKEYVKRGAKVTGIDISSEMVRLAEEYCPQGEFEVGNTYALRFNKGSFDIVTASSVIDHLEHLDKVAKEVCKVLKPDGLFFFSAPHPTSYMFRNSEKGVFIPTDSYFNRDEICYNLAKTGKICSSFPRTMQDYFQAVSREGFVLENLLENTPSDTWKQSHPSLNENCYKMPVLCLFKWRKS